MIEYLVYIMAGAFSAAIFEMGSDWDEWCKVLGAFVWPITLPVFLGAVIGKKIKRWMNK